MISGILNIFPEVIQEIYANYANLSTMFYKNGGKIKVSLRIGYVTVQEDLLWIISVGRQRRDQEKGIGLKNPNVKYKDLHTMTTGSQVREWTMKHSIICCYWWSITFTSC